MNGTDGKPSVPLQTEDKHSDGATTQLVSPPMSEKKIGKKQKIPSITSNSSGYATAKASAVVSTGEIGRIVDLGLGRGVDITKTSPWLEKSSFQVRRVDVENIIGTEEGGSLQNYEREIVSIQDQQCELKASITVPKSPVTIGVDAEMARSHAARRRSIGKKVVNRTISYRADFHDAPKSSTGDARKAKEEAPLSSVGRKPTIRSRSGPNISGQDEAAGVTTYVSLYGR